MTDTPTSKSPKPDAALAKAESDDAEVTEKRSLLGWAVGWVLLPGLVIGLIWGGGVLVGVHLHDSWFVRAIIWMAELFGG